MKYNGPSIVSARQVGSEAVIIKENTVYTVLITDTETRKVGSGSVATFYKTSAFPELWIPSTEVFDDETDAKTGMPEINDVE